MKRFLVLACALACVLSVKCCEAQITGSNNGSTISVNGLAQQTAFATVIAPSGDTTGAIDSAAVNAVCSANGWAQLKPASTYYLTGITVSNPCKITGGGFSTKVVNPSATANLFTVNYSVPGGTTNMTGKGAVISDFEIVQASGVTPTAGCAFSVAAAAGAGNYVTGLHVQNIHVYGLYKNVCVGTGVISDWFQNIYASGMVAGASGCVDYNVPSPGGDIHLENIECTGSGAGWTIRQSDTNQNTWSNNKLNGASITFTQAGATQNINFVNFSIEGDFSTQACGIDFGTGSHSPTRISFTGGINGVVTPMCNLANATTPAYGYMSNNTGASYSTNLGWVTNQTGGVTSIDSQTGAFTFTGSGVSHTGNTYTFASGASNYVATPPVIPSTTGTAGQYSIDAAHNLYVNDGTNWVQFGPGSITWTSMMTAPTFSPAGGSYYTSQSVSLTNCPSGGVCCYTTNGTDPAASTPGTCSAGSTYSTAISVSAWASTTIKALATKTGYTNSSVASQTYSLYQLKDTFGGSGVLTAHSPDGPSGATWTTWTNGLDGSNTMTLTGSGGISSTVTTQNASAYSSVTPASSTYLWTATCTVASSGAGTEVCAVMDRMQTANKGTYAVINSGGTCYLGVYSTSGAFTQLGGSTASCAWANSSTHTIGLQRTNNTMTMYVDGASTGISATDSTYTTGVIGIRISGLAAGNQGGYMNSVVLQ